MKKAEGPEEIVFAAPLVRACLVLAAAAFVHSCAFVDRSSRIALVYGVSRYITGPENDGGGPNLRFCDDDADAMARLFEANGYATLRRISGDTNPTPELPSKAQILADLASLPAGLDRVILYYSGHGDWDEAAGSHCIMPYGSVTGTESDWAFDPAAFMTSEEMHAALAATGVSQIVLVLDACFSGGFVQNGGGVELLPPAYGPEDVYGGIPLPWPFSGELAPPLLMEFMGRGSDASGAIVMAAAGAEEFSWEDAAAGHGVFTTALLSAPAAADSNDDGTITALEAYAYAAERVNEEWNEMLGSSYYDFMPRLTPGSLDYALFSAE